MSSTVSPSPTAVSDGLTLQTRLFLIRLHGVLMITAWMLLIPVAVLSARYLKDHWQNRAPFGLKMWFHIHRTSNLIALPLIITSTLLIFIAKDWAWTGPVVNMNWQRNTSPGSVHSLLGTIAILIVVVQCSMALFRCAPDHPQRHIFNSTHKTLGIAGLISAVVSILIASNSFVALWKDSFWAQEVSMCFVLAGTAAIIIFEILTKIKAKRERSDFQLRQSGQQIIYDTKLNRTNFERANNGVTLLFGIFVLLAFVVTLALIVILIF